MKKVLILLSIFLLSFSLQAQVLKPVKWSWHSEKISNNEYNLIFKAKIDKTWAIYSQFVGEGGPIPTSFTFDEGAHFKLAGKTAEGGKLKKGFDKVFEMEVAKFHDEAIFTQKVKIIDPSKPITGFLTYMTCDDTRCLPPTDEDFSFDFPKTTTQGKADPKKTTLESAPVGKDDESNNENGMDTPVSSDGMEKPVEWSFEVEKINETEYQLKYIANIDKGWGVYSMYTEDNGPLPTAIHFDNSEGVQSVGKAMETGKKKSGKDPMFDNVLVTKFSS